ncbi:MAG: hypothetical protein HY791_00740 [Deltaproteobacteria bacterium]|nr:hypothetical protein [Deltaproteobacteria bacterium]
MESIPSLEEFLDEVERGESLRPWPQLPIEVSVGRSPKWPRAQRLEIRKVLDVTAGLSRLPSVATGELKEKWEIHFRDQAEFLVEVDTIERTPGLMVWAQDPPKLRTSGLFRITCAGLEGEAKFQGEVVLVQDRVICLQINQHDKAKRELRAMRDSIHILNPSAQDRYHELLEEQDLIASATSEFRLNEIAGSDPWGDKTDVSDDAPAALAPISEPVVATAPELPKPAPRSETKSPGPEPAPPVGLGSGALVAPASPEDLFAPIALSGTLSPVAVLLAARATEREVRVTLGEYALQLAPPGLIVGIWTPNQEGVLDVLVKAKVLTQSEKDDLSSKAKGDDRQATRALASRGNIASNRLASAFRDLLLGHAEGISGATGKYSVEAMVDPAALLAVSFDRVLKDVLVYGARRLPPDVMRRYFDERRTKSLKLISDTDRLAKLKLKSEHQRFVETLSVPRLLEDTIREAPMSRDALQQLMIALLALKLVAVQ